MNRVLKRLMVLMLSLLMVLTIIPLTPLKVKAASGVDDFVTRCYKVALQRDPDKGGFDFWKAKITNGELVGSTVVYEFIFSKEYEGQNRSDKEFVNDLYTMFMGRAADQGGYDYWCGQMASGMTRKEVFAGFANSQEFYELCYKYGITSGFYTNDYDIGRVNNVNLFVERLYKTCLGRLGDQGGQKYWVEGMLKGELTGIGCAANYIKSAEYEDLGLSNEKYVENLYVAFMGRTYDEGGKTHWLNQLNSKTKSRDQVFEGFANSPEFQGICAGYGIECGSYTATDFTPSIEIREYENKVNIKTKTKINSEGRVTAKYEYDSKGNLIAETIYNYMYTTYEYNEKNQMIKTTKYDYNGRENNYDELYLYSTFEYGYDEDGNFVVRENEFQNYKAGTEYPFKVDGYGIKQDGYRILVYDKDGGNLILNRQYSLRENCITEESWYEYDSRGRLIKEMRADNYCRNHVTITYEYNSFGKVSIEKATGGYPSYIYEYEYDEYGNVIVKKSGNTKYLYKYDEYGNLIEEKEAYYSEYNDTTKVETKCKYSYTFY